MATKAPSSSRTVGLAQRAPKAAVARPAPKPAGTAQLVSQPAGAAQPLSKPAGPVQAQPQSKTAGAAQAQPQSKPAGALQTQPQSKPAGAVQAQSQSKPAGAVQPQSKPGPAQAQPQSKPTGAAQPVPEPKATTATIAVDVDGELDPQFSSYARDSPRSQAYKKLIAAMTDLDADSLRKALLEAAGHGISEDALAACQAALQELEAPGAIGTLAEREKAAATMAVIARDGTEVEIQQAILSAIDVGLEDGFLEAEAALAKRRAERHNVMDKLLAAMEVVVISAEQDAVSGPGCSSPEELEALADALVEARSVAVGDEEELLNSASRLLEFELKRSEAVRTLNVRLRQHAQAMEKIVDDFQVSLGQAVPNSSEGRAAVVLDAELTGKSETNPAWRRQSYLRKGSRRRQSQTATHNQPTAAIADEVPPIPGAEQLQPERDLRPDLRASVEDLRRLSGQPDASGVAFSIPKPKSRPSTPRSFSVQGPASPSSGTAPQVPAAAGGYPSPPTSTTNRVDAGQAPAAPAVPSAPSTPRSSTTVSSQVVQPKQPAAVAGSKSSAPPRSGGVPVGTGVGTPPRGGGIQAGNSTTPRVAQPQAGAAAQRGAGIQLGTRAQVAAPKRSAAPF